MPCNCSSHRSHRQRNKYECKNAFPGLEIPSRKQELVNYSQRDNEETQNAGSFYKVQKVGTEKSCVCCICNKKLNDVSKTRLDEEGYHSASVSMNQLHKPEEHERRSNQRNKLKELFNENESEQINEVASLDGMDTKLEPEVVAAALLAEDGNVDLGKMRPGDIFNKLFLGLSPETVVESSARNSQSVEEIPVIVQGQAGSTLDTTSRNQETQRLRASSTPYRNDIQNSGKLELPAFGSPITERVTDADSHYDKNESKHARDVLKPKTPLYGNRVQLNGSVKPSWFPGFTVVSPLIPEYVRITSDPTEGLREAWRLCQPRHFDEVSKSLVNTG